MSMRESTYFVLAALLDERRHGYAIIKKVEELSGGRVRLATGTLYAALERLVAEGYVAADGEEIVGGRARRYYTLTDSGSAALRAEAQRMAAAAKVVTGHASGRAARVRSAGVRRERAGAALPGAAAGVPPGVPGRTR